MELLLAIGASALAGCLDAIVGGGGLILLPALFAAYPQAAPADLLGTNKSASVWGTAFAGWRYSRRVSWSGLALLPALALTMAGSVCGAWLVTHVSPELLRRALPAVLLAVLVYTLIKPDLGRTHAPRGSALAQGLALSSIGAVVGFYDGFFGPGTGSFFVFLLVRVLGYDFLHASATAKLLNLSSNAAALALFGWSGHVLWHLALPLALANVLGSSVGTRLALRHGTGFVRGVFLAVVSALILKTTWDAFVR